MRPWFKARSAGRVLVTVSKQKQRKLGDWTDNGRHECSGSGGTSGIGLATAVSSAQRGATVFAAGRSLEKIEACQASYPDIQFRQVDTHDPEGLSDLFSEAGPIHHLVGAATGATRTNGPFMSQSDEQFRAAFDKSATPMLFGKASLTW